MQITIDSTEPLDRVLPVINAVYGVNLATSAAPAAVEESAPPARRSRASHPRQGAARRNKRPEVAASAVRTWARSNGHEVSSRGRVAAELIEAYRAAHTE